jgi:hypothetical protein
MARSVTIILAKITCFIRSSNPKVMQVVQDEICKIVDYALFEDSNPDYFD